MAHRVVLFDHAAPPAIAAPTPQSPGVFAKTTFLSDLRADLALCKVPTLVLQRAHDVHAPVIVGAYVHTQTLVSQLVVLNATGHRPNLSVPTVRAPQRAG